MLFSTEWTATIKFEDGEKENRRIRQSGLTAKEARARFRAAAEREYPGEKFSVTNLKEHIYDGSH